MTEMKVNPYDVKGDVDYDRLIKEFGLKKIDEKLLKRVEKIAGEVHPYLRREIFFAHRDLEKVLDAYEKGEKFFLYTGNGPSGPVHLGHYSIWSFVKWLQDKFNVELWFQFTDDEKFLYKDMTYDEIQGWLQDNMLDVVAMDFDPKKTHFLIDTKHSGIMYPEAIKVAKKITFSTIKSAFGFTDSNNIGSIFYTAMQTVPSFLPNVLNNKKEYCLIPMGVDQDPHFRISRDVVGKLGHKKPSIIHAKMMSPLTGVKGKSGSSSNDKTILMTDDAKAVKKKINKYAFSGGKDTVEEHREKGGDVGVDVACQWLKYFEEDDKKLKEIYDKYSKGELLSGEIKAILIDKINETLSEHQSRRKNAKKQIDKFIYKN
jgi:tryptophanyl-tRNA synthetase